MLTYRGIDVNNYPLLGELSTQQVSWTEKEERVIYAGGITAIRGISQLVDAMSLTQGVTLDLAGQFSPMSLQTEIMGKTGWKNTYYHGLLSREDMAKVLGKSKAGIVTFLPAENHIDAQPNKMFEYMSAGLPVIGSNFPLWKDIIVGNNCGLCVDPSNPEEIAEAIEFIIKNPESSEKMGLNGQKAVHEKYNWNIEEDKLISLYNKLLNNV